MEEIGLVKSVEGMYAKVDVPRKSTCEVCTIETCKPGEQSMEIEALNPVKAKVGQKVKVVMKPYTYLKGSFIVYGIPALALVLGAILGKFLSSYFKEIGPDVLSAILGFSAFTTSFVAIKLWSKRLEKKVEYKPVIEEILE